MVLTLVAGVLPASAANNSSGINIPPRKNYTIKPGDTVTDKLIVGNLDSQENLSLGIRMIDFSYTDTSGTPKLYYGANTPQTPWSLKPFATIPSSLTVGPNKTEYLNISIKIPKGQGAGSYYGAIAYSAGGSTANNSANVGLSATGVTLVFVSVPGTVNENMTLQKFGAYMPNPNVANTGSFLKIAVDKPREVAYQLLNSGNVAEQPVGTIELRNMFGGKDIVIENANPFSSLALRGQSRLFQACIASDEKPVDLDGSVSKTVSCKDPKLMPGRYTMKLDLFYGQNGNQTHEITQVATFWYLPWWFIVTVVGGLAFIVGFVWWAKRKITAIVKGAQPKRFRR